LSTEVSHLLILLAVIVAFCIVLWITVRVGNKKWEAERKREARRYYYECLARSRMGLCPPPPKNFLERLDAE